MECAGGRPYNWQLVQERFPVGRHSSCGARCGLIFWMRMRRKQLHALDHSLLLVIVEPILTRLEAGNDRMPCRCRMFGCMLARRTVAATDVPTLRTPAEMKPPTFRERQAFHAPIAAWFRFGVDSAQILFHFRFSFRDLCSRVTAPLAAAAFLFF
jgi:hypothetical protein